MTRRATLLPGSQGRPRARVAALGARTPHRATRALARTRRGVVERACAAALLAAALTTGCLPTLWPMDLTQTLGIVVDGAEVRLLTTADAPQDNSVASGRQDKPAGQAVDPAASSSADFRMFAFGGASAGETWLFSLQDDPSAGQPTRGGEALVTISLFDESLSVLVRAQTTVTGSLVHTLRRDVTGLHVGIAGAREIITAITIQASHDPPGPVPTPVRQIVWLDFGPAEDLVIGDEPAITFGTFDARELGQRYAQSTSAIKTAIVAVVREHYAIYDVDVLSSDDDPAPTGPVSRIHFGGRHPTLLGKAHWVDRYNAHRDDRAIVYTGSAARYAVMDLTDDEMGRLLGNTAAHELGHLLGLYHTLAPESCMDTSGGVWDLAGARRMGSDPLDPRVFPIGWDDAPRVLAETVGLRPAAAHSLVAPDHFAARSFQVRGGARRTFMPACSCMDGSHAAAQAALAQPQR